MNSDSKKVMETKEKIRDAFFELYKEKKIERISIKEITDKAGINRGTFYVYYNDIYDLLEQIEDGFISELIEKIKDVMECIIKEKAPMPIFPALEFYEKYSKYLKMLLGNNGDPNFIHKLKNIAKRNLKEILREGQITVKENTEYIIEYVASAQIGLITYWMEKDMELPIEEISHMIREISLQGPVRYMKKQSGEAVTN